jgi:dTDP-4-amino-4,6-dideoxygalactose transaminase
LLLEDGDNSAALRAGLNEYLAGFSIPSMIYYPVPGHRQKMFAQFNVGSRSMPVTDWLTERVISLPVHTELDEEQLQFITTKVLAYLKS